MFLTLYGLAVSRMHIKSAQFITSSAALNQCPETNKPEWAFIGRSNVGKSSLINFIVNRKNLAKTSGKPGKTQTINHFLINEEWYLVDLPGYGYAGVSQRARKKWGEATEQYLLKRQNLYCVFVLIDSRHHPQSSDLDLLNWLGNKRIPLAIVMTKIDKLSKQKLAESQTIMNQALTSYWEEFPPLFSTSTHKKVGKEAIHDFIEKAIKP